MRTFKSFYEEMTFKVEVDGLPALFMSGNSPGEVKSHLRKLIKQPSMIKSVERQTKHDVKKMYRAKAQGKEVAEATLDERTPVRPTVRDKKLKNLRVPNPNYKGLLKRKKENERSADKFREGSCGDVDYGSDKSIKIMKKKTPGETNEKLTIGKIRRAAYKTGKVLGDVQAVKTGKVAKRVKNRVVGKLLGKAVGKLGLFK